ncbi:MAG: TIGR04282 family arsenosugar biosynthesis glycosyltransferase [Gammaproteobacteria bacterium]|nr:TIGR04282 family arsenosugar biosynthesis glycosyltransferase [Gammaproteobacteria bacterium]MDH5694635.1 TIGR04282 family arsenosugar biosynthesis glycosyltransferase [Gammaproteobacteria bacterium]
MNPSEQLLIVFAKAPLRGEVKTRLGKEIGFEQSAAIHKDLVEDTLRRTISNKWQTQLWCTPTIEHVFFQYLATRFSIERHLQSGADLGERMLNAIEYGLRHFKRVVLIGTDCPLIEQELIDEAFQQLKNGCDVIITPAEDGGYVLIGAKKIEESVFSNIEWGTAAVLSATESRLAASDLNWKKTKTLWDIDELVDWQRYQGMVNGFGL